MTIYALVQDDTIVEVGLPANGIWNDGTRDYDTRSMTDPELAAIGWLPVVETPRPPDTATTTFDLTYELVNSQPTQIWVERPKTQAEIDAANQAANSATLMSEIQANIDTLKASIDALKLVLDTPNTTINASPAKYIKDTAREAKTIAHQTIRIAKVIVGDLDDTDSGAP